MQIAHNTLKQVILSISLLFALGPAMAVEEPKYQVLLQDGSFEHRLYASFVVAETTIKGDFDAASRTGFRRIAGYIFGDSQPQDGAVRKISMTAPVTVAPQQDGWRLHFVMPSAESLGSLPRPNDPTVELREVPEHQVASVRFSGWTSQSTITEQTGRLQAWIDAMQLKASGPPQVARYNDPFTLPWRRRNEILIPLVSRP